MQPTPYTPTVDFSDEELTNAGGRTTIRAAALDAELTALQTTLAGVLASIYLNQRDDGNLRDQRVKLFTLAPDVLALLAAGQGLPRGAWLTGTVYALRDMVTQGGNTYICSVAHTAGTFATDLAAVKWLLLTLGTTQNAAGISFSPTATLSATTVQSAIEESDTENRALSAAALAAATSVSGALGSDLASTAIGKGASLIGVQDAGGYFTGTTQEAVNQEIGSYLSHVRTQKPAAYSLPRFFRALQQYRHDLQAAINIVGFGSSVGVGATLPTPSTQAPVAYFKSKLKSTLDAGNLYNLVVYNDSVNGSALAEVSTALAAAVSAGHTPKVSVLAYGMNDAAVALFNSGQTFPSVYTYIMNHVKEARALGADVILMTTPHHKTASGATLYAMPPGIPQNYPTVVAANVAPESLLPPASTSNITADFLGTGTSITVSHRHLRVNQAMRQAATDAGVPLIDVERYWFAAIAKYGEAALFDAGETVHPNLLGHQQSYWLAIDEFIEAMCRQTAQEGQEPRLNGLVGLNTDLPAAVLDVRPPYPDATSPSLQARARIGAPDGGGVKQDCVVWRVENTTGDLVGLIANTASNAELEAFRKHATIDPGGTAVYYTEERSKATNSTFSRFACVTYNVGTGARSPVFSVPDNSMGTFWVDGYNSGLGRRRARVEWVSTSGTITFGTVESVGAAVFTGPTAAGLTVSVNVASANTQLGWQMHVSQGL